MVRQLVEQCHFDAVIFESQVYDFINLHHAFERKTATASDVADAIGGLWSKPGSSAPLVEYLYQQAHSGRITLAGLDPQIGGATQRYTQEQLPAVLAQRVPENRRVACAAELARLTTWQYDEFTEYDDATRARLHRCLTEISTSLESLEASRERIEEAHMATNMLRYLEMAGGNKFNVRDRAMFDNLKWHLSRLPKNAKVIVWSASVHGIKTAMPGSEEIPMGSYVHRAYKGRAATVGFSAWSGSFGRPGKPAIALDTAAPGSLEAIAFTNGNSNDQYRYFDNDQLVRLGIKSGRVLNYRRSEAANWGNHLDGLIVMREEHPLQ